MSNRITTFALYRSRKNKFARSKRYRRTRKIRMDLRTDDVVSGRPIDAIFDPIFDHIDRWLHRCCWPTSAIIIMHNESECMKLLLNRKRISIEKKMLSHHINHFIFAVVTLISVCWVFCFSAVNVFWDFSSQIDFCGLIMGKTEHVDTIYLVLSEYHQIRNDPQESNPRLLG